MMSQPLVSIIVPVYNVAHYLPQCLDSILGQSYPNFEVLLINDGSTDGSGEICRSYTERDSRFRLIDKPNSGVSDSRNQALDQARGKYLQFVDADDFLAPQATETLLHTAESTGADLIISHFYRLSEERAAPKGHIKGERLLTRAEFAEEMVKAPANFYYGVLWNKLYRRSVVEAHHLRFDREVNWCEDFLFNLEYIQYTRLVSATPEPLYYYRKRDTSLINSNISLRRTVAMKRQTFIRYKQLYQKLDLYDEQKAEVYRYLIAAAGDSIVSPLAPKLPSEFEKC